MSCGVVHRCGSDPTLLRLWHSLAAAPLIRPLAWELACAMGVALKTKPKQKKNPIISCKSIQPFLHLLPGLFPPCVYYLLLYHKIYIYLFLFIPPLDYNLYEGRKVYLHFFFLCCLSPTLRIHLFFQQTVFEGLYSFPVGAVTNYHKQITQMYFLTGAGGKKSKIGLLELKSRCQLGCVLWGA